MRLLSSVKKLYSIVLFSILGIDISPIDHLKIIWLDNIGKIELLFAHRNRLQRIFLQEGTNGIQKNILTGRFKHVKKVTCELISFDIKDIAEKITVLISAMKKRSLFIDFVIPFEQIQGIDSTLINTLKEYTKKGHFFRILVRCNFVENKGISELIDCNVRLVEAGIGCCVELMVEKDNLWEIDEQIYHLLSQDVICHILPTQLERQGDDYLIEGKPLTDDERYNLLLLYHKLIENKNTNVVDRRQYVTIMEYLKTVKTCSSDNRIKDLVLNGFTKRPRAIDYYKKFFETYWLRNYKSENAEKIVKRAYLLYFLKNFFQTNKEKVKIFIVGWYGTETVGDKAILGGIINFYKEKLGKRAEFIIGSLYPYITERTMRELQIEAKVVNTQSKQLLTYSAIADEVIMGGGPLMDLHYLYVPLISFKLARKFHKKTVVFGCGLGPLKTQKHIQSVKEIMACASTIMLRDTDSVAIANDWGHKEVELFGDPAKKYLTDIKDKLAVKVKKDEIACFLRDLPNSFYKDFTTEEFLAFKTKFENSLAKYLKFLAKEEGAKKIVFYHMHNFVIGGDDRDYSRYFIHKYFQGKDTVAYDKGLSTVDSIARVMLSSKLNVCMRFHSVLFADTLNTRFKAVDYTSGGKIKAFLTDNKKLHLLRSIDDLNQGYYGVSENKQCMN